MGNTKYQDKVWLRKKYVDEHWTTLQIGKFCGVSHKTVSRWLEKYGIPTRDNQTAQLMGERRKQRVSALQSIRGFMGK